MAALTLRDEKTLELSISLDEIGVGKPLWLDLETG